jgi:hypothetical protein
VVKALEAVAVIVRLDGPPASVLSEESCFVAALEEWGTAVTFLDTIAISARRLRFAAKTRSIANGCVAGPRTVSEDSHVGCPRCG